MITRKTILQELRTQERLVQSLCEEGFMFNTARRKVAALVRCREAMERIVGAETDRTTSDPVAARTITGIFVPGRIEVLGKHTDYAGGDSITFATELGFTAIVTERDDRSVTLLELASNEASSETNNAASGESCEFTIDEAELLLTTVSAGDWRRYPMTVARRLGANFRELRGVRIVFISDLPRAAGMSSSSALMILVALALIERNGLWKNETFRRNIRSRTDLANYLATVENGQSFGELVGESGVGTFGGSEDHVAILASLAGTLRRYRYAPVRLIEEVPVPAGVRFIVTDSGVVAEKTGAVREQYNQASRLAAELAEHWRRITGRAQDRHLGAAFTTTSIVLRILVENLASHPEYNEERKLAWWNRLRHFERESRIGIPSAMAALQRGDLRRFGEISDDSQRAAAELLGNQIPETIRLAGIARELGAVAASAFGAGFGGSVWAMVDESQETVFIQRWLRRYTEEFPERTARMYPVTASPPAMILGEE